MIRKLMKFVGLPYQDKKIMLHVLFTLLVVKAKLSMMPFQKVLAEYNQEIKPGLKPSDDLLAENIAQVVDKVANYLPNTLCLPRALAVKKMLSDYGYHSDLHIGTMKNETGEFQAHAWVEKDSKVLIGYLDDLYQFSTFSMNQDV